ncbi:MAG: HEAT repeat domain-containing protein [Myxococcota bacterium]|jgi:hypothetical protein|nr:HEAT repeat domain-containing protein [Myxococcota bacterium]
MIVTTSAQFAQLFDDMLALEDRVAECENPFSAHLDAASLEEARADLRGAGDLALETVGRALAQGGRTAAEAVRILCALAPSPAVQEMLFVAVEHRDEGIRAAALTRLARLVAPARVDEDRVYGRALRHVRDVDLVAVAAVDAAFLVRGARALRDALGWLAEASPRVTREIAGRLGGVAHPQAAEALAGLCAHPDREVRRHALEALAAQDLARAAEIAEGRVRAGGPGLERHEALAVLVRSADAKPGQRAPRAVRALAGLGGPARARVLRAFWDVPDSEALLGVLRGPPGSLAGAAGRRRLEQLAGRSLVAEIAGLRPLHALAEIQELHAAGYASREELVAVLRRALDTADYAALLQGLALAEQLDEPGIVDALARLDHTAEEHRIVALLARYGDASIEALLAAHRDPACSGYVTERRLLEVDLPGTGARVAAEVADHRVPRRRQLLDVLPRLGRLDVLAAVAADATDPDREAAQRLLAMGGPARFGRSPGAR